MDLKFRNHFLKQWAKYFGNADLPITFFYTEDPGEVTKAAVPKGWSCIVSELALVRNGKSLTWNVNSLSCGGSKRYFGYSDKMRPNFEYFLSYGIEKENPKAVLGMFDVSARPWVPKDTLTMAIPMKKFKKMVDYMDESFLITGSWEKVRERINKINSH